MPGKWCWDNDHEIAIFIDITGYRAGSCTGVLSQPMVTADHASPGGGGAVLSLSHGEFLADRCVYYPGGRDDRATVWMIKSIYLGLKIQSMAYNLLKGKKGIVFGALDEKSIAWRTALRCHEEGAQLVLTNAPVASTSPARPPSSGTPSAAPPSSPTTSATP